MDPLKTLAEALGGTYATELGQHTRDTAFLAVDFDRADELVSELAQHGVYLLERNLLSMHRYSAAAPIPDGLTPANTLQVRLEPPSRHAAIGAALAVKNLDSDIRAWHAQTGGSIDSAPEPLRELLTRTQCQATRLRDLAGRLDSESRHLLTTHLAQRGRHHGESAPFGHSPATDAAIDTLATLLEDHLGSKEHYSTGLYKTHAKTIADHLELLDVAVKVTAPRAPMPRRAASSEHTGRARD